MLKFENLYKNELQTGELLKKALEDEREKFNKVCQ